MGSQQYRHVVVFGRQRLYPCQVGTGGYVSLNALWRSTSALYLFNCCRMHQVQFAITQMSDSGIQVFGQDIPLRRAFGCRLGGRQHRSIPDRLSRLKVGRISVSGATHGAIMPPTIWVCNQHQAPCAFPSIRIPRRSVAVSAPHARSFYGGHVRGRGTRPNDGG
jgi:hypothetical protein